MIALLARVSVGQDSGGIWLPFTICCFAAAAQLNEEKTISGHAMIGKPNKPRLSMKKHLAACEAGMSKKGYYNTVDRCIPCQYFNLVSISSGLLHTHPSLYEYTNFALDEAL
jgi:hypothetical protein